MSERGNREPTETQRFILEVAARSPGGIVGFTAGDRSGTRVAWYDGTVPYITAYGTPEYFLKGRGWLAPGNERHTYRITDAGREAIRKKR